MEKECLKMQIKLCIMYCFIITINYKIEKH